MKITHLKVNHLTNPIGYLLDKTVFSYTVDEALGKAQTAARIQVATDERMSATVFDSGMSKGISSLGYRADFPLLPYTRYYWQVTVLSDKGEEATSDIAFFETAKRDDPWVGQWITCEKGDRHPVFSKAFALAEGKTLNTARLYITGLGLYHATVDKQEVTAEKLTPYYTDYAKRVQYQTYDITSLCRATPQKGAAHRIDVTLGNGWYGGRLGWSSLPGQGGHYGDGYRLLAEIRLTFTDGSVTVIPTDTTWQVSRGNITFSNIYDGEHRDDTLPPVAPVQATLLVNGDALPVYERLSLPVTVHEEIPAIELIHTPAGETVFDIGQNLAGGFRLRLHEPKGTVIHIQVGEVLQQGNFYRDNLRTALAEYYYTASGEPVTLEPLFTFYGYRYVKVEGATNLKREDMTALAYYSDVLPIGRLETGDDRVNQLLSNIAWGQKGNFIDVPTDCPQRDERLGWTADTQVFVPTAAYLTDAYAFYRKYMTDLRDDQAPDGCVPNMIPATEEGGGASVWGDACTIIPWTLYTYYGDTEILKENIGAMGAWVDYITRVDGDTRGWKDVFQFGDWLALDNHNPNIDSRHGGTDESFIGYVYYRYSARIVADAAKVLLKEAQKQDNRRDMATYTAMAEKYSRVADEVERYLRETYFTPDGKCLVATQTAYALALRHGLCRDEECTLNELESLIGNAGKKLLTGFTGTPIIPHVLSHYGRDGLMYDILLSDTYPGWLYEIKLGATTVWERWNSLDEEGRVTSIEMNSFNHYAYGSVGEWLFKTAGGILPDERHPGFKGAILRPVPNETLGWARAAYGSPAGRYETEWKILPDSRVYTKVTVPFDCTATLQLPLAKEVTQTAGEPLTFTDSGSRAQGLTASLTPGVYELVYQTE